MYRCMYKNYLFMKKCSNKNHDTTLKTQERLPFSLGIIIINLSCAHVLVHVHALVHVVAVFYPNLVVRALYNLFFPHYSIMLCYCQLIVMCYPSLINYVHVYNFNHASTNSYVLTIIKYVHVYNFNHASTNCHVLSIIN